MFIDLMMIFNDFRVSFFGLSRGHREWVFSCWWLFVFILWFLVVVIDVGV